MEIKSYDKRRINKNEWQRPRSQHRNDKRLNRICIISETKTKSKKKINISENL